MREGILIKRKRAAIDQIVALAGPLAEIYQLEPSLVEALKPTGTKDRDVLELWQLEGIAQFLDGLARAVGAPATETVNIVREFRVPDTAAI